MVCPGWAPCPLFATLNPIAMRSASYETSMRLFIPLTIALAAIAPVSANDGANIHHSSRDLDGPRKQVLSAKCQLLILAREELRIAFSSESVLAR